MRDIAQWGRLMRHLLVLCSAFGLLATAMAAHAQQVPVKLVMDWAFEGPQAIWPFAKESGCFSSKNLNVTIDRGFGSGDAISKVASGTYDIGVADFSSVLVYNAAHPENRLLVSYVVSDRSPTSVVTLRKNKITTPKDLEGKRISDPQGEASRVLFPVFADKTGIDPAKVGWVNVTPNLRQTTLVQGQADAVAGHLFTVVGGLHALGLKDEDLVLMPYANYGVDLLGNSVIAKPQWMAAHKEEMKGFLSCATAAIKSGITDPEGTIAVLKKYTPMGDHAFDIESIHFSNEFAILTPQVKTNGLSEIDRPRLQAMIANVAKAAGVTAPAVDEIWTDAYLPPKAERQIAPR